MSYASRVYRQRNPKPQDEKKETPFFSKQEQKQKSRNNDSFFQAKLAVNEPGDSHEREADSVANAVINQNQGKGNIQQKEITPIQRLATTHEEEIDSSNDMRMERDKDKPFQRKPAGHDKEKEKKVQKKDDPEKEKQKEKVAQKKEDSKEKDQDKAIQKKDEPLKEKDKDKTMQKKEESLNEKDKAV